MMTCWQELLNVAIFWRNWTSLEVLEFLMKAFYYSVVLPWTILLQLWKIRTKGKLKTYLDKLMCLVGFYTVTIHLMYFQYFLVILGLLSIWAILPQELVFKQHRLSLAVLINSKCTTLFKRRKNKKLTMLGKHLMSMCHILLNHFTNNWLIYFKLRFLRVFQSFEKLFIGRKRRAGYGIAANKVVARRYCLPWWRTI